ncbi:hypothetical protein Bca101_028697 [Brassica carinata]
MECELRKILEEVSPKSIERMNRLLSVKDEEIAKLKDEVRLMSAHWKLKTKGLETQMGEKRDKAIKELRDQITGKQWNESVPREKPNFWDTSGFKIVARECDNTKKENLFCCTLKMASVAIPPVPGARDSTTGLDKLPEEMNDMKLRDDKEMEPIVVDGNGTETGHIIVTTIGGRNGQPKQTISYMAERVVGQGSFGVVFQAKCLETGETVAIKKVLQDRRYKNRELQTMRLFDHPNVVSLKHCFFSTTEKDELYLNLVLEYVPETVHRVIKHYNKLNQRMPLIYVKLYTYQIFRALSYIHRCIGVCHRDIKPQNLLVNPHTHQVKLCDFGSAKVLVKGEPNISYICSRYYRAPELIFGATEYTTAIDVWSAGCVLAELLLGQPLFPGESGVDQLVEIIKVLGTPTREEIKCMNPNYTEFKFPQIKAHPWHKIFHKRMPPEAVDLVSRLLQYSPNLRSAALDTLVHPFFDELRDPNARLPNGRFLPPLFNFKPHGKASSLPSFFGLQNPSNRFLAHSLKTLFCYCCETELKGVAVEIVAKLVPEHARKQCPWLGL